MKKDKVGLKEYIMQKAGEVSYGRNPAKDFILCLGIILCVIVYVLSPDTEMEVGHIIIIALVAVYMVVCMIYVATQKYVLNYIIVSFEYSTIFLTIWQCGFRNAGLLTICFFVLALAALYAEEVFFLHYYWIPHNTGSRIPDNRWRFADALIRLIVLPAISFAAFVCGCISV